MKRIAVFSDTHGNRREMRDVLACFAGVDTVLHLGDGLADGEAAAMEFGIPFLGVAGNEDAAPACPRERIITAGTWRMMALHGDQFDIGFHDGPHKWMENKKKMAAFAAFQGAGILLFGHSHAAMLEERDGVVLCNPGDQYAGSSSGASFCLLDCLGERLSITLFRKRNGEWVEESTLEIGP